MPGRFQLQLPHTVLEAANWSRNLGDQRKRVIVLHSMECPEKGDTAEWCARYFAGTLDVDPKTMKRPLAPRSSAHFCIDNTSIVQCVPAERVAWHAPGCNTQGVGLEHGGYARQTRAQWLDPYGVAMLRHQSAPLCAALCRHFGIPIEFLDATDLRAGLLGITTHEQVTLAWPDKGTHRDPGPGFPMRDYLDWVRLY